MYFHNSSFQVVSLKRNRTKIWSSFCITVDHLYCGSAMVSFKACTFQIIIKSPQSWRSLENISNGMEQQLEGSSQKVLLYILYMIYITSFKQLFSILMSLIKVGRIQDSSPCGGEKKAQLRRFLIFLAISKTLKNNRDE